MNQVYEHPQRNNQVMQPGHIRPCRKEPRLAPYGEGLAAGVGDPNRASSSNIDQKSVHTDNDGKLLKRPRIIFGNRRTKSKASKSKPA